MKKIASLIAGLLVLAGCSSSGSSLENSADFAKTIQKAGVVTLDVRTPGEYAAGHIQGAINIDVEDASFQSKLNQLDKNVHYAVYCHSGRRSAIATQTMSKAGFKELSELDGGIQTWTGPLVTN